MSELMDNYPVEIGEKIKLIIGDDSTGRIYTARITAITADGFTVNRPELPDGIETVPSVMVQYIRDDAVYRFAAKVVSSSDEPDTTIFVQPVGDLSRIQRREYVRINYGTPINYTLMGRTDWRKTKTFDLSAGGLSFLADVSIKKDDLLMIKLADRKDNRLPEMVAARCRQVSSKKDGMVAGVEFIRSDNLTRHFGRDEMVRLPDSSKRFGQNEQNRLVHFIFEEQVKIRNRKLI